MKSKYITIEGKSLHYLEGGKGHRLLIAIHGYGNDASIFEPFVKHLEEAYVMVFLDLPHHGNTHWKDQGRISKELLAAFIFALMRNYQVEQISLLGYSIGGRLCLCLTEEMSSLITECVLVAPDGLRFNPFYYFVTKNGCGKWIFRKFLSQQKHLKWIDRAHNLNWIDLKKYKFSMRYLASQEERDLLYKRWNDLALLVPDHKLLRRRILQHTVPLTIFMGKNDSIIPPSKAKVFMKGLSCVQLHLLDKGHRMLDAESVPVIAQTFLKK